MLQVSIKVRGFYESFISALTQNLSQQAAGFYNPANIAFV
jgi:hypothetical protein